MNIYSNNEMAEMLAPSLGSAVSSNFLPLPLGAQSEIQLVNGSGLGVANRISPRAVCAMFVAIQRELLLAEVADFPVAGRAAGNAGNQAYSSCYSDQDWTFK